MMNVKLLPCDDAISRQAAMDCFKKWQPYMATRLFEFEKELLSLPSVTPQPKTGHWIRMKTYEKWGCSECDAVFRFTFKEHGYCPNCGAKMVEPQERSDKE